MLTLHNRRACCSLELFTDSSLVSARARDAELEGCFGLRKTQWKFLHLRSQLQTSQAYISLSTPCRIHHMAGSALSSRIIAPFLKAIITFSSKTTELTQSPDKPLSFFQHSLKSSISSHKATSIFPTSHCS